MKRAEVISLDVEFGKLKFVGDRTPESSPDTLAPAFAELAPFGEGAILSVITPAIVSGKGTPVGMK